MMLKLNKRRLNCVHHKIQEGSSPEGRDDSWVYIPEFDRFEVDYHWLIAPVPKEPGNLDYGGSLFLFYHPIWVEGGNQEPNLRSIHPVDIWCVDDQYLDKEFQSEATGERPLPGEVIGKRFLPGKIIRVTQGDRTTAYGMIRNQDAFLLNEQGKTVERI